MIVSPLGSEEPLPSRVTAVPDSTVWSAPAFAVGGDFTLTTTLSLLQSGVASLSQTSSLNSSVAGPVGAAKVAPGVVAPVRVTLGPLTWVQLYLSANDSSLPSDDSNPLSETFASFEATLWSGPAFAVGARLAVLLTATLAKAGAVLISIVLGSAASTTLPGSQPKRTLRVPATTDSMSMPPLVLVNPGGFGVKGLITVFSRKLIGPLAPAVQVWLL